MKRQVFRLILVIAGVLTVLVILLSQSFYQPAENNHKAKTEQKAGEPGEHKVTHIIAPADVVPSHAIEIADHIPTVLKSLITGEEPETKFVPAIEILTNYFHVLFGAIISPNAP